MPPLLPRFTNTRLEDERKVTQAVLDASGVEVAPDDAPIRTSITKPGDPRRLRGIPIVARGVPGCQPGSNPLAALIRKEFTGTS